MIFVATEGASAVYEGQGSWSKCIRWILQLPLLDISRQELVTARREFGRDRYAALPLVKASFLELEALGLQRADK
ncbi:hypothetical protein ACPOL_0399 [Acidisarcina polymorpha]|uniref:Uncharacterized protein n=1 Tax=Acidisarcina polymorpha TaxID=2211140 RepID=A0A2Z5FSG3_9BACT|nr:hypothetical protein ACPOL_0399 [Acidisarcina polymorpha]